VIYTFSSVWVKCSQTQLLIFILLRCVLHSLTTTCFGLYNGNHQVVHFLIIKQTIQYTMFLSIFVDEISSTKTKTLYFRDGLLASENLSVSLENSK